MARTNNLCDFLTDIANAIRSKKGTSETIPASDFDTEIENLPSGGGGIYRKESVAEMNAIENPSEGDVCIVSNTTEENISSDSTFNKVIIPASFTVSAAAQKSVEFRNLDTGEYLRINMKIFGNDTIEIGALNSRKTITFTKSGTTRTRSDSEESETFEFSSPLSIKNEFNWVADMSNYVIISSYNFIGIYEYTNSSWEYLDVGTDIIANDIIVDKKGYSSNGALVGTFGNVTTRNEFVKIRDFVANIDTSQLEDFSRTFTTNTSGILIPYINTSSATNMSGMFSITNYEELNLSNFDTSNVTDMSSMFYGCSRLKKLNISGFSFANVTNYEHMFGREDITTGLVPADCEIIVADDTQKTWITSKFSRLTNVKTVAEYEAEQNA